VPIRRAKSLEQLYAEVQGYDRVFVPDAPLARALNRQIQSSRLGEFVTTPRQAAVNRGRRGEDRAIFLELLANTELTWKEASHLGEEIIHCWEYTTQPDAILEYDGFDTPAVRRALEVMESLNTVSRDLTEYRLDPTLDVAVIGASRMTPLEQSILPPDVEPVDRFTEESFQLPEFRLFDTSTDVVDAVVSNIDADSADDVAVVLDSGSEYSAMLEAALEAAGIPFYGGSGFLDRAEHRGFLQALRVAFRGEGLRLKRLAPILRHTGAELGVEQENCRVTEIEDTAIEPFQDWARQLRAGELTFTEALLAYRELASTSPFEAFQSELELTGLSDRTVEQELVDDLFFYLQRYEPATDRDSEGVLLADATSAAYVDRDLVVHLGLDAGFTRAAPRRPWVDREREFARHLQQFQLLIQNGAAQHYLVREAVGGEPVQPTLYFGELLTGNPQQFGDLGGSHYRVGQSAAENGFSADTESVGGTADKLETISQTSLSGYLNSPRDYFFEKLVDSREQDYFKYGNLYHDFAEFYVHNPDQVDAETIETLLELFDDEMAPFVSPQNASVERTRHRAGIENIMRYLDEHAPTPDENGEAAYRWQENDIAAALGTPIGSGVTEQWFESPTLGIKGKIDLVESATRLADYKSGRKKSAREVVKNSTLDPVSETPNVQALMYLTEQRNEHPETALEFTFVHFLENVDDLVRGEADIEDTLTTVEYLPTSFEAHAKAEAMFDRLRTDAAGDCVKTLAQVEYSTYRSVFEQAALPATRDSDELIASSFGRAFIQSMQAAVGEYKYVISGCEQAMRELMRVRSRRYFAPDLDAFETFVADQLESINERRAGHERFPVVEHHDEPNYRWLDHRDLILEGEL
jgi:hypothetical protein